MRKKKNPFVNYTVEQIIASEAVSFIIIVGADVFDIRGRWAFDKKTAIRYYRKILNQVMAQINHEDVDKRETAERVLRNLRIQPLRMQ